MEGMTRRALLVAIAAPAAAQTPDPKLSRDLAAIDRDAGHGVEVLVGPGKDVTVKMLLERENLVAIMAEFFARDHQEVKPKLRALFADADNLTMMLTTRKK